MNTTVQLVLDAQACAMAQASVTAQAGVTDRVLEAALALSDMTTSTPVIKYFENWRVQCVRQAAEAVQSLEEHAVKLDGDIERETDADVKHTEQTQAQAQAQCWTVPPCVLTALASLVSAETHAFLLYETTPGQILAGFSAACKKGDADGVAAFLCTNAEALEGVVLQAFSSAIEQNHVSLCRVLLTQCPRHVDLQLSYALAQAADLGHLEVVQMLLADGRAAPTYEHSCCLMSACTQLHIPVFHIPVIKALILDGRANPALKNFDVWRRMIVRGHSDLVGLLLLDCTRTPARTPTQEVFEEFIHLAVGYHQTAVLQIFLADARIPVAASSALFSASSHGFADVVSVLLTDGRMNPRWQVMGNYSPLSIASDYGHLEVVNLLLRDGRADVANALWRAVHRKHVDVAEALLADRRVDPAENKNNALYFALMVASFESRSSASTSASRPWNALVDMLIKDVRVNPAAISRDILCQAAVKGEVALDRLLRQQGICSWASLFCCVARRRTVIY